MHHTDTEYFNSKSLECIVLSVCVCAQQSMEKKEILKSEIMSIYTSIGV